MSSSILSERKNTYQDHKKIFLNRCVVNDYEVFSRHIGAGHRTIQETGAHHRVLQTFVFTVGFGKDICWRSWNYLSFDVFLDPTAKTKGWNLDISAQPDPTDGSQTLGSLGRTLKKCRRVGRCPPHRRFHTTAGSLPFRPPSGPEGTNKETRKRVKSLVIFVRVLWCATSEQTDICVYLCPVEGSHQEGDTEGWNKLFNGLPGTVCPATPKPQDRDCIW